MAIVAALTGMRSSELFALSWPNIDFERQLIRIWKSIYHGAFGPPKVKANKQEIPMSESVAVMLKRLRLNTNLDKTYLVFANAKGKPYDPWQRC